MLDEPSNSSGFKLWRKGNKMQLTEKVTHHNNRTLSWRKGMDLDVYILHVLNNPKYSTGLHTYLRNILIAPDFFRLLRSLTAPSHLNSKWLLKFYPPDGSTAFQVQNGLVQCSGKRQYKLVSGTLMCHVSSFWSKYATVLTLRDLRDQRQIAHFEVNPVAIQFHVCVTPLLICSTENNHTK